MATVTIRLDDTTKEDLEAIAAGRNQTVSDLVRTMIDELVYPDREKKGIISVAPTSVSAVDRKVLSLLHRILARLVRDDNIEDGDKDYQLSHARILEYGFTGLYIDEFIDIHPELSKADCDFVMDVFDMFTDIQNSITSLEHEGTQLDGELLNALQFSGFDFNDSREGALASFGQQLINEGRWENMAKYFDDKHEHGNSHFQAAEAYSRMLEAYKKIQDEKRKANRGFSHSFLNLQELQDISKALVHPSHR